MDILYIIPPLSDLTPPQLKDSPKSVNPEDNTRQYLRDTEDLLTSLQARVTDSTPITSSGGYRIGAFEDSGGDSDVDTSTSYAMQESPAPAAALRSKLKLQGLEKKEWNGLKRNSSDVG